MLILKVKHQLLNISIKDHTLLSLFKLLATVGMKKLLWSLQKSLKTHEHSYTKTLSCHATGPYEANFDDKLSLSYITHFSIHFPSSPSVVCAPVTSPDDDMNTSVNISTSVLTLFNGCIRCVLIYMSLVVHGNKNVQR